MPPLPVQPNKEIQELIRIIDGAEDALSELDEPPPVVELTESDIEVPQPSLAERLGDSGYERYARVADQAYKDNRIDLDGYEYVPDLSTSDHGVYESSDEIAIGVRGTSTKTPFRDLARDIQVALGSASVLGLLDPLGEGVRDLGEVVDRVKKEKPGKKIHVTGHSLGGSIASLFGVQNPDVDISTFNKGEGLPFLSSTVRCTISGCRNIANYRIAGDFASLGSKISNVGEYRTLPPVRPTPEVQEEAALAGGFFIEPELYLPHSVSNFIGRSSKKEMSSNIYARPLAAKIGRVAGATLPIAGGILYNQYLKTLGEDALERAAGLPSGTIGQRIVRTMVERGVEEPGPADIAIAEQVGRAVREPIVGSLQSTLSQVGVQGVLGRSVGELAGLAFYEGLLAD